MTPFRSQIYEQLESGTTYSIEQLAHRYRTNEHVISIFLDHTRPIWVILSYIFMGFILVLLFSGVING